LSIPDLDGDRFEIRGTLGAGGAGIVYRAFDRQRQREVALKLLRHAHGRDLFRFKREFRALADIVHPHLVSLYELHTAPSAAGEHWYFTMELVEGVSFIDWVRPPAQPTAKSRSRADIAASPCDHARLRASLVQLVDALVALHEAGKLHRDLKPSNVLVAPDGRVVLLDFGLVLALAEDVPENLAVGTPVYMSPEQAADQPLEPASDWYSLGAMIYEALAGRRPIEGEAEQIMIRKQTELPVSPLAYARGADAELAALAVELLHPEARRRPSGHDVLARLGASASAPTRELARTHPHGAFVGRDRELATLTGALADARARGTCVMVRGRSGIGKTALVRAFLRGLGDDAFVLEGRCFEREAVPFKMLDGVVDELTTVLVGLPASELDDLVAGPARDAGSLVRLFPVLRRVPRLADAAGQSPPPPDAREVRRRGFDALRATLARLAVRRPVVVFVDDVHWGDADSAAFFAELVERAEPRQLIILAHRPEDYLGIVARLRRRPSGTAVRNDARELDVAALPEPDARELALRLGRGDRARADAVVAAAHGNPYVVSELARAPELDATTSVEELVATRAARLTPDAQAMLAVSCIAARPLPVDIAAHAAGVVNGLDVATQLASERLATLRRAGDQALLHPAHDYVRTAVVAGLDHESRAGWHEALARAFEEVQGEDDLDSLAVVEHWLAAGHPAFAAQHAVPAARRAEDALAFRRAAELYEIALAYGPWDTAGQRDLLRRKAHALACAGQLDEAANIYNHAAQLLPDDEAIDLERLHVEALLRRGRIDEALPAAERLLAQVGLRLPLDGRASRTRLATQWVQMKLRGLDYVERDATTVPTLQLRKIDVLYSIASGLAFADPALGRVVQAELRRAALDAGEPVRVCLALAQELVYAAAAGHRNRAAIEAVGARLAAIARRARDPYLIGLADTAIGIAAYMRGSWADARARFDTGLATLRDHGVGASWELDVGVTYAVGALYYLGDWREMARVHGERLRDALDRDDVVAQQSLRTGRSCMAWLVADRADDARDQLAAAEATLAPGFHLPHVLAVQAAVNVDLYTGDVRGARARLEAAWPQIDRIGAPRLHHLRVELDTLRARIALADGGDPRAALATAAELIRDGGWAGALGSVVRASALAQLGEIEPARAALAAADDQLAAAQMAGWLAVTRLRRAQLDGDTARCTAARATLKELGTENPEAFCALLVPWPADRGGRL
jgi:tetratricopeptide (TPR) repeat protein/tRNA A-37 threonylcarbamoyl transferase component Bud32